MENGRKTEAGSRETDGKTGKVRSPKSGDRSKIGKGRESEDWSSNEKYEEVGRLETDEKTEKSKKIEVGSMKTNL